MGGLVSPDASRILFSKGQSELWVMGVGGEEPHRILSIAPSRMWSFAWSPTSRRVVFLRADATEEYAIESCDLHGAQRIRLYSELGLLSWNGPSDVAWLADGRVLFRLRGQPPNDRSDNIWSIEVDPDTGRVRGQPEQISATALVNRTRAGGSR